MPDDAVCATQLLLDRPLINGVLVCFLYAAATIPWRKLTVLHDPRFLKQMPAGCVQDVIAQVTSEEPIAGVTVARAVCSSRQSTCRGVVQESVHLSLPPLRSVRQARATSRVVLGTHNFLPEARWATPLLYWSLPADTRTCVTFVSTMKVLPASSL